MASLMYRIKDHSKEFLQKHKFRYSSYLSECGDEVYTYKLPLAEYNKATTIECEIDVSAVTGIVNVNVYNAITRGLYAFYYDRDFGNCELLNSIDKKIDNKLKELGIEKV